MGTDAWENWRAQLDGKPEFEDHDGEAQSDLAFFGGQRSFGSCTLSTVIRDPGEIGRRSSCTAAST